MPKRLFDVISEKDLATLIYEEELSYQEAAERIKKHHGVKFHRSTIGKNWRKIRDNWIINNDLDNPVNEEIEKARQDIKSYTLWQKFKNCLAQFFGR